MKRMLRNVYTFLKLLGIDPLITLGFLRNFPTYFQDLRKIKKQSISTPIKFNFGRLYPCLGDKFADSGFAKGHYFHQDLLVARKINLNNPQHHVDVGSRIDSFVAHVAAFREIEVIDIRPLTSTIPNVSFKQSDMMMPIDKNLHNYCDSLSCLHTLEHFGLGRYGDPINYNGYISGLNNLYLMLKPGGKLYFSVPIGPQRIEFNAHRVFSVKYLLELVENEYSIDFFSYVDDFGDLHENVPITEENVQRNFECNYGCGIFELTKQ